MRLARNSIFAIAVYDLFPMKTYAEFSENSFRG